MKKENQAYLDKINEYLNDNLGFVFPVSNLINNLNGQAYFNVIVNEAKQNYFNQHHLLTGYCNMYFHLYEEFMKRNMMMNYHMDSKDAEIDRKVKNVVIFNAVMDNIFEHVLMPEIHEYKPNFHFEPKDYTFGAFDREDMEGVGHHIADITGENYLLDFQQSRHANDKSHYSEISNGMNNITRELANSDSEKKTIRLFHEYVGGLRLMRAHYNNRLLSRWFTINGWRERAAIKKARENLMNAVREEHRHLITVSKDGMQVSLQDLSDAEAKEALKTMGDVKIANVDALAVGQKLMDFREGKFAGGEKPNLGKAGDLPEARDAGHMSVKAASKELAGRMIKDEDLEESMEDILIDRNKVYEHVNIADGKKLPTVNDIENANTVEENIHHEPVSLQEQLAAVDKVSIDRFVRNSLKNDVALKEKIEDYNVTHQLEKAAAKQKMNELNARDTENLTEEEKESLEAEKTELKDTMKIEHDMNPVHLNKLDDKRKNYEINIDDIDIEDEFITDDKKTGNNRVLNEEDADFMEEDIPKF